MRMAPKGLLEGCAHFTRNDDIFFILTKHIHIVHVAEGGLLDTDYEEVAKQVL
jgi:hypothetical protein